jgi:hypothetical protein
VFFKEGRRESEREKTKKEEEEEGLNTLAPPFTGGLDSS